MFQHHGTQGRCGCVGTWCSSWSLDSLLRKQEGMARLARSVRGPDDQEESERGARRLFDLQWKK
jgi:hypothetical protein